MHMEVKAKLGSLKVSPYKVRLVLDLIRNNNVLQAEEQLMFSRKAVSKAILKLLKSAVASAVHNFKCKAEDLYIKEIFAGEGVPMKRWMPRAHGRAGAIRKRSSIVTLVLAEKIKPVKKEKTAAKTEKKAEVKKEQVNNLSK